MQINKYNNTSFTARNYEIRRADNIMRNMLNQYPSRSTTKQRLYPIVQNGLVCRSCSTIFIEHDNNIEHFIK